MSPKSKAKAIQLSPSALNLFRDCPRCFWFEKVKFIKRPRGIFPSLPSGMDRTIKEYFDVHRSKGVMPPEFSTPNFEGIRLYPDQSRLDLWREWRTGLQFIDEDGSILFGALDDLLVKGDKYIPFDYKTKGSPTTAEDAQKYYQNQMDCYALMQEANGLTQEGRGYLLYFSPKNVSPKGWVNFNLQAVKLDLNPKTALATFREAVKLLSSPQPPVNAACEYCAWIDKMMRHHAESEI